MSLNEVQVLSHIIEMNKASDFHQCFDILTKIALKLGFDGVLYSYLSVFSKKPVLVASPNYGNSYIQYYYDCELFKFDHIIYRAIHGDKDIIYWFDEINDLTSESYNVLETSKKFGVINGVSIRTFLSNNAQSFAGTSLICRKDNDFFYEVCVPNVQIMQVLSNFFHHKITVNQYHQSVFIQPVLNTLSPTKDAILKGLACGENLKTIAGNLSLNEKYVRNLAANLPKDLGCKNREQLMYLAGMLELGASVKGKQGTFPL